MFLLLRQKACQSAGFDLKDFRPPEGCHQ
jgi:hypothetical protein